MAVTHKPAVVSGPRPLVPDGWRPYDWRDHLLRRAAACYDQCGDQRAALIAEAREVERVHGLEAADDSRN